MIVRVNNKQVDFQLWQPGMKGRAFRGRFAFHCATMPADQRQPWHVPRYVLGAACDRDCGYFIQAKDAAEFLRRQRGTSILMHEARFTLAAVDQLAPPLDIYKWVDRRLVWDTELLHRLYVLGTTGHTASGTRQPTLDHCEQIYLGIAPTKDSTGLRRKGLQLSYRQWPNRRFQAIELSYLEFLATDTLVVHELFHELHKKHEELSTAHSNVWGIMSPEWLLAQHKRWGWQTHHIQLRAAIVLGQITANGLTIDRDRPMRRSGGLATVMVKYTGVRGHSAVQGVLRRLEERRSNERFPRTPAGAYATSAEALEILSDTEPLVSAMLQYDAVRNFRHTLLNQDQSSLLHPLFDVLTVIGRTRSVGEINTQHLPRDVRVRSFIIPSAGHVFLMARYKAIELVALAQAVQQQFGVASELAEAINRGRDPHRMVAAQAARKSEYQVTVEERQKAKVINFGKPGGMASAQLRENAEARYRLDLGDAETDALSAAWFHLFPEMERFLSEDEDVRLAVARFFDLSPAVHYRYTHDRRFARHPQNNERRRNAHPTLGAMCLRVLRDCKPKKPDGTRYSAAELDLVWSQVKKRINDIPAEHRQAVRERKPSPALMQAIIRLVDRLSVLTLTGRRRADASYCARRQTVIQGLAADGAKLALWKLSRAGYKISNFLHDEVLIELPRDSRLALHAAIVRRLLIEGMRQVIPDVRIDVEYALAERWYDQSQRSLDDHGRLVAWSPAQCVND